MHFSHKLCVSILLHLWKSFCHACFPLFFCFFNVEKTVFFPRLWASKVDSNGFEYNQDLLRNSAISSISTWVTWVTSAAHAVLPLKMKNPPHLQLLVMHCSLQPPKVHWTIFGFVLSKVSSRKMHMRSSKFLLATGPELQCGLRPHLDRKVWPVSLGPPMGL